MDYRIGHKTLQTRLSFQIVLKPEELNLRRKT